MNHWKKGAIFIAISLLLATGIAVLRWHLLGQDWSAFISISEQRISRDYFQHPVAVYPNKGYDGQFYFALATNPPGTIKALLKDPEELNRKESPSFTGIHFDNPVFRAKRIVYPLLAWVASGFGNEGALPIVMVLLNIIGLGLAVGACFWINKEASVPAVYYFVPLFFLGGWMCLYRDLAGQLGIAFALIGIGSLYNGRFFLFAVFGTIALLTKETAVFLLMGSSIYYGLRALRQKQITTILLLGTPFLVYLLWSTLLGWNAPQDHTLSHHFTWPFAGMAKGFKLNSHTVFWLGSWLPVAVIALEGWVVLWKKAAAFNTPAGLAFLLNFIFVIIMSKAIFIDPWSFARNILPLQYAAFLLILEQRKKVHWITLALCIATTLSFHFMVISRP